MKLKDLQTSYSQMYQEHKEKKNAIEQKIHQKEAQLERLNTKLRKLPFPSWLDHLVRPIANELEKVYPDYHAEILGPFGICSETAIHLYKKGLNREELWAEENREAGSIKSITFIPGDLGEGEISIRNYEENTGTFRKGTIGELNGMNYPSIELPEEADIEWLKQYIS